MQICYLNGKWQLFLQNRLDVASPSRGRGEIAPPHSTASNNAPPSPPSCPAPATPLQLLPTSSIQGSWFSPAWSFVSCPQPLLSAPHPAAQAPWLSAHLGGPCHQPGQSRGQGEGCPSTPHAWAQRNTAALMRHPRIPVTGSRRLGGMMRPPDGFWSKGQR